MVLSAVARGVMSSAGNIIHIAAVKPQYDLRAGIGQALDLLAKFKSALQKNRVKTIEDFENEGTLDLGGEFREQPVSAEAKSLFHYFAKTKSIKQCYEFLNEYCRLAEREELDTPDMFGRPPAGRAELLEQAEKNVDERRRQTEGPAAGNDLFAGRDLRELRQPGTPAQKPAAPADRAGVAERPSPVQGEVTPAPEKIEEGKRYSLEKRPKNIEEFRQMESHPRPESVKFESVKELYDIYKQEYLGKTFNTISGQKITFKPGHFFRLIAGTPKEGRKGWIAKAANAADAIRMIENGEVDFADIAGYQRVRADNIKLFKDVLQDGDFWYPENNQRIVFGKKYQGLKDADGFVAVTLELDNQGDLGPVSFHPQRFSDKMFEGKDVNWTAPSPLGLGGPAGDVSSRAKSSSPQRRNIAGPVENSSADTEKNQKKSANRYSISPVSAQDDAAYLDAVKAGDLEMAQQLVQNAARRAMPDTQVTDANGEPLVVYHGTHNDFTVFDLQKSGDNTNNKGIFGNGFYFSDSRDGAAYYNRVDGNVVKDGSGNVMPAYLAIRNPFVWSDPGAIDAAEQIGGYPKQEITASRQYRRLLPLTKDRDILKFTAALKNAGYDGVIYDYAATREGNAKEFVAFSPEQIKSAETVTRDDAGNVIPLSRRFDPGQNDIRYSLEDGERRHQQVNPVFNNDAMRAEYQDLLDHKVVTEETLAQKEKQAQDWVLRQGGIRGAAEMIANDTEHSDGTVASIVRTAILNSDVYPTLPAEVREKLVYHHADAGSAWSSEGRARQLRNVVLHDMAAIRGVLRKLNERLPDADRVKLRNDVLHDTGIDIFDLPDDLADNPAKLDQLLRSQKSRLSSLGDKVYEAWIEGILSALTTHASNVIGNTTNALYELGPKRFAEAAVNLIARRPDAATFGEFREMWRALNFKNAARKALAAFDLEVLNPEGKFQEHANVAIPGRLGRPGATTFIPVFSLCRAAWQLIPSCGAGRNRTAAGKITVRQLQKQEDRGMLGAANTNRKTEPGWEMNTFCLRQWAAIAICSLALRGAAAPAIVPERLFQETEAADAAHAPGLDALAFASGDGVIYGQILKPDAAYGDQRPCVILFHGFAGFTRWDDVGHALCRAGCVVVIPHHRGAWGSTGNYSITNCIEDAVNLGRFVTTPQFRKQYRTSGDRLFFVGHSMGGNTALNAAGLLPNVRGVALLAPCDVAAMARRMSREEMRVFLLDNGLEALHSAGFEAVYEDVCRHPEYAFASAVTRIGRTPVFLAAARWDSCIPLAGLNAFAVQSGGTRQGFQFRTYPCEHGFLGARLKLTRDLAEFIENASRSGRR